jgi:4-hydroxy-tetrahydrodipicolinate synthase
MSRVTPTELRSAVRGAVVPILAPFAKDGGLDLRAVHDYVRFLVGSGVGTVITTAGTSRFNLLSLEEIAQFNRAVVEATGGDCLVIVAGPMEGDLSVHEGFAKHAAEIGADGFIGFFPERYYGDDALFGFFQALTRATTTAVLLHEMPMRNGLGGGQVQYSLDVLERITDLPGIGGFKEECMDGGYSYKILRRFAHKTGVIGAGSMRFAMRDFHAGAQAYLVGIGNFLPKVEIAFHRELVAGNVERAHELVRRFEEPYFDVAVSMGWHRALKETLHLRGLMPPYERSPMPRLGEADRKRLDELVQAQRWPDSNVAF